MSAESYLRIWGTAKLLAVDASVGAAKDLTFAEAPRWYGTTPAMVVYAFAVIFFIWFLMEMRRAA